MSKKRKGRRVVSTPSLRYTRQRVPSFPVLRRVIYSPPIALVPPLGDRRVYLPDRSVAPVFSISTRAASRVVAKQNPAFRQPSQTKALLTFAQPSKLPLCTRRRVRKQVIHALGVAGSKNLRRPRRNQWSDVKC